ncbi:HPr kinase/phosphorylase [Streptomyces sp. NPDC048514]|uniref:HPr kinase/phosphorylase n=1 Tax=Streptomyces sp. NPDC048514 TaxID=3365564 RepID=UPI003710A3D4
MSDSSVLVHCDGVRVRVESYGWTSFPAYASVVYTPYFDVTEAERSEGAEHGAVSAVADVDSAVVRLHLVPEAELDDLRAAVERAAPLRPVPVEIHRSLLLTQPGPGRPRDALDPNGRFVYRSDPRSREVDLWASDVALLLLESARLVRTVVVSLLVEERNHVPVHASCVALDGRAVVFTGSSGSGKTTLALAAMQRLGARFITNDLVMLRAADDPPESRHGVRVRAFGMPLPVRMATGTLQGLGLLGNLDPYQEVLPFVEAPDWRERERKIEVGSGRVASWFGTAPLPSAELACLVWPRLADGADATSAPVPRREVPGKLYAEVPVFDPAWPVWTGFGYPAPLSLPPAAAGLVADCAGIDAMELRGGRDVHAAVDTLARFLAAGTAGHRGSVDPEVA